MLLTTYIPTFSSLSYYDFHQTHTVMFFLFLQNGKIFLGGHNKLRKDDLVCQQARAVL